jgi:hypothetical protein
MKRFLPVCLLLLAFAFCGKGQVNLVPNGDFEQYSHCPDYVGQIDCCLYWFNPRPNSELTGADYLNTCATNLQLTIPSNNFGFQYPHSGNAFSLISIYESVGSSPPSTYREYIEAPLINVLQANKCYHLSFYINLPDRLKYTCNDIGAFFSENVFYDNASDNLHLIPQFKNTGTVFPDTINWLLITGDIIANGGEAFIILGNFDDNATTTTYIIDSTSFFTACGFYIDDVCLIETDLSPLIPHDTTISPGDSIYIGGPAGIGLDDDCIWYVDGIPIDTIAGMWVKPDTTTTYVLQQTICGNVKYDTVTVMVSDVGIGEYGWGGKIRVYPNPAKDVLTIEGLPDHATAEIYSINGKLLLNEAISNQQIDIRSLADGMYFIKLSSAQGSVVRKFVKE